MAPAQRGRRVLALCRSRVDTGWTHHQTAPRSAIPQTIMPVIQTRLAARAFLLGLALAVAGTASAAAIYGSLKRGEQPLAGAEVKLVCPGGGSVSGNANAQGNYNLSVTGAGRCAFSVGDKTTWVVLSADPARYDFEVPADAAPLSRR